MNRTDLVSLLRAKGLKVTPQRLAIFEEVLSREDHPTAEQIHNEVRKQNPAISLTTIYHTLEVLRSLGLLQEFQSKTNVTRYDPNTSVHVNIICKQCDEVWDYESKGVHDQWEHIISEIGVDPVGQRLDAYVVCDECKRKHG